MPNILDTRDLRKRLSELEDYETAFKEAEEKYEEAQAALSAHIETVRPTTKKEGSAWDDEWSELLRAVEEAKAEMDSAALDMEEGELAQLREMESEIPEWRHGETLINDSYFESYAQELAEDTGAIDSNATWPLNHINWEAAAEDLKSDYTPIEYDGETYWYRG
jgi:hypothetical protein